MSIETLAQADNRYVSFAEYAEQTWLDELVRGQNDDSAFEQPIFLQASLQKLCAESLIRELGEKPYFQRFGGKILDIVMLPTSEPYMYNVALRVLSVEPK